MNNTPYKKPVANNKANQAKTDKAQTHTNTHT